MSAENSPSRWWRLHLARPPVISKKIEVKEHNNPGTVKTTTYYTPWGTQTRTEIIEGNSKPASDSLPKSEPQALAAR